MRKEAQKTKSVKHFALQLGEICSKERNVNPEVLKSVIELAIEVAREGREGRKIGTMFIVGDEINLLAASHH